MANAPIDAEGAPPSRGVEPQEPPRFSLVAGGPFHRLSLAAGLTRPDLGRKVRWAATLAAVTWLPLLALSWSASGGGVSFLQDIEVHVRLLVALPMLVLAEVVVHGRLAKTVQQFVGRDVVPAAQLERFRAAIASAERVRDSWAFELGIGLIVATAGQWIWHTQVALAGSTWYASTAGGGWQLTAAGHWYAWVSVPLFRFLLWRWYGRLLIWFRFLWQVSRLDLRLVATHPDRAGGLGFVGNSCLGFGPLLFAQGALVSGTLANKILYDGRHLTSFKLDILGLAIFALAMVLAPLLVFSPLLLRAKREGLSAYGDLANRYVREFEGKWVEGGGRGESLMGSADLQSLADLANGYTVVKEMRPVPFNWSLVMQLAVITVAPLAPLTLTAVPLETVIDQLFRSVL